MAPSRKVFYFVLAFFFLLAQFPSASMALAPSPIPRESLGGTSQQLFLGAGGMSPCEPCWLGRGRCRKMCNEDEKIVGNCKVNFFCCRRRIM
ncbi:beta-defensin 35-like [Odocoileus virginianus]|uniref:Beta-defensin n=1 Tax=Odocoileus virginianus TaxID=9874 RepID=A0ABM4HL27_ODOVR